jgi:hypothetical protein
MTRIVEILIAVNALAGIAAFLGLRHIVRRRLFRRDKANPSVRIEPDRPTSSLALRMLRAKPVEEEVTDLFSERVYVRFRNGRGRTDVVTGVSEADARQEAEAHVEAMKGRDDVESAILLEADQPDGPAVWRTTR